MRKWFVRITPVGFCLATLLFAGCHAWQHDVTVNGIAFTKARVEQDGLVIGMLKENTIIGGRPCKRGWVHVHTNGVLSAFTTSRPVELERFTIPVETWVIQTSEGAVRICAFPQDTEVQGHVCRGSSGGAAGVQAAFYPGGALKQYFLRHDTTIQGVPCKAGLLSQSIVLHENGRLKSCTLNADFVRDGHSYRKGDRIRFDPEGRISP